MEKRQKNNIARDAQVIALEAFTFIAGDDEQVSRFIALTGIDPAEIRQLVGTESFLTAVLDYIASDESLLLAFAANRGLEPSRIAQAIQSIAPHDDSF